MFGDQPAPLVDPCILVMELAANNLFAFGVYVMFHYNFDDHIQLSPMPEAWGTDQGRKTETIFFLVLFLRVFQWGFTAAGRCSFKQTYSRIEGDPAAQSEHIP
jgi:hypothetical protein